MPIAPYPYKITCIKCQIATTKAQLSLIIDGGGPIACEKHQKELQKELQKKREEKKK